VARGLIGRVDVLNRPLEQDEVVDDYLDAIDGKARGDRGNGGDERGGRPGDRGGPDRGHAHDVERGNGHRRETTS